MCVNRTDNIALLSRMKQLLAQAFGRRLRGVVLFGSQARGESRADSDIDLLVLLDGPVRLGADLKVGIDALYPMALELGRPIHPLPVDCRDYESQDFPLYRRAKKEGIAA
jgi:uncharacterized protein